MGKIIRKIKRFFYRIKNVIKWLPTIWKDKQHDHEFITEILIKKLELTRDFFASEDAITLSAKDTAKEIDEIINLLKKSSDSFNYYDGPFEILEKKWGKTKVEFIKTKENPNYYTTKVTIDNVKTPEDKEQYDLEYHQMMKSIEKECLDDRIKAYTLIAKNIEQWWD